MIISKELENYLIEGNIEQELRKDDENSKKEKDIDIKKCLKEVSNIVSNTLSPVFKKSADKYTNACLIAKTPDTIIEAMNYNMAIANILEASIITLNKISEKAKENKDEYIMNEAKEIPNMKSFLAQLKSNESKILPIIEENLNNKNINELYTNIMRVRGTINKASETYVEKYNQEVKKESTEMLNEGLFNRELKINVKQVITISVALSPDNVLKESIKQANEATQACLKTKSVKDIRRAMSFSMAVFNSLYTAELAISKIAKTAKECNDKRMIEAVKALPNIKKFVSVTRSNENKIKSLVKANMDDKKISKLYNNVMAIRKTINPEVAKFVKEYNEKHMKKESVLIEEIIQCGTMIESEEKEIIIDKKPDKNDKKVESCKTKKEKKLEIDNDDSDLDCIDEMWNIEI